MHSQQLLQDLAGFQARRRTRDVAWTEWEAVEKGKELDGFYDATVLVNATYTADSAYRRPSRPEASRTDSIDTGILVPAQAVLEVDRDVQRSPHSEESGSSDPDPDL